MRDEPLPYVWLLEKLAREKSGERKNEGKIEGSRVKYIFIFE